MASTIKLKNGSGAPTTGDLVQGEPALDLTNKRLYTENASGVVIEVGTNPTSVTTGNITANGTINLTGATVSNAGSITTADINGGTIDGTVIGGTTPAAVTTSSLVATTADINAGTIDGTVIGGSSAAAITGTTITGTSFVSSGDMTFGDSDKAIFGAGSDLQIYHDGLNSYIKDAGTGDLVLNVNNFRLKNAADSEIYLYAQDGGGVNLYHTGNAIKLATTSTGIDVTGTVTADGLTASGSGAVGSFDRTDANAIIELKRSGSLQGYIGASTGGDIILYNASAAQKLRAADNGDISFYEDTGTTAKFFWDASAESLGIGGTQASSKLFVDNGAGTRLYIGLSNNIYADAYEHIWRSPSAASEAMRIDSSGRLLVGLTGASGFGRVETDTFTTTGQCILARTGGNLLVGTTSAASGSVAGGFQVQNNSGTGSTINIGHPSGAASGFSYALFSYNNSIIGSIGQSGTTAVLYNTSSDERLKENITDANDAGDKIDAIKVRQYDWKADGSHQDYGMIAQELMTVAPEAVSVPEDPEQMMGVDYSKLVPMLIKEIQSLRNRVAQLEGI